MSIYSLKIKENNNLWSQVYYKKVFTPEECQAIINYQGKQIHSYIKNEKDQTPYIQQNYSSTIDIPQIPPNEWIFRKLLNVALDANRGYFNFQVSSLHDTRRHIYKPGDFHEWHVDIGVGEASTRKLSLVAFLSPRSSYEGGDLVWNPTAPDYPQEQGTVVVFPTYILHRVEPVIRGERCSMVTWLHGHSFR